MDFRIQIVNKDLQGHQVHILGWAKYIQMKGCIFKILFDKENEHRHQNNYIMIPLGLPAPNLARLREDCLDALFCVSAVSFFFIVPSECDSSNCIWIPYITILGTIFYNKNKKKMLSR
ncbi:hypothetical protein GDO81_002601 [Engystomops pustulosus]|uniref:Uncharacterized protein n=1 Tax=Engystomops pustulosus TaxID=76066 RepID=A0AAV7DP31_ENGPU|nr:hypothetical protein GDO81_002601 [Engystomops pustulosus]